MDSDLISVDEYHHFDKVRLIIIVKVTVTVTKIIMVIFDIWYTIIQDMNTIQYRNK